MTDYVAYLRVSTDKQGKSGLGLEAQQAAIDAFLKPGDRIVSPKFVEVESGTWSGRPQLAKAIARCRSARAVLLIARLDRLARNVHFISGLMELNVHFMALDCPSATPLELHMRAAFAEEEARKISERTKAALAAAKARGKELGGDRGYRPSEDAKDRARVAAGRKAIEHAITCRSDIQAVRTGGAVSLNAIAIALNERGVATPRGDGTWTATAVRRTLARLEAVASS